MSLPSKKKIGVIGGGQLGKMLAEAGSPHNLHYNFLDAPDSPCSKMGGNFINGSIQSQEDIIKLASISDILTFEIEHINTDILKDLEKKGKEIIPKPSVLEIIKDKGKQNEFLGKNGIPIPYFINLKKEEDWVKFLYDFKGEKVVVKSRKGGYDGKGVQILTKNEIINGARPFDTENTLIEEFIEQVTEISVIVAVDKKGNTQTYPPVVMEFDPISNLVMFLHTEHDLNKELEKQCKEISVEAVKLFKSPGLFAVELFIKKNTVFVNEIAPRPHNSGHHTIEGCYTSQFEQLNRILLGQPLGNTQKFCPAAMINLVGSKDVTGSYQLSNLKEVMCDAGIYIHLYGKKESRPDRKLGHITVIAENKEELFRKVGIAQKVSVVSL
jgi:5-(carboxyamino)imidazole ribonucleotide synthase